MLFPPIDPPPPTFLDNVGNVLLILAGVALFSFMVSYGFFASWRKYPAGRAVMYFVSGLSLLLGHYILSRFMGGDYLFRDLIRAFVYGFLFIVTLRLLVTFWVIQARGNREEGAAKHSEFLAPWKVRMNERKSLRIKQLRERRALRVRQNERRWGASDDQAAHDASDAHQEAEGRSSSSPTSG